MAVVVRLATPDDADDITRTLLAAFEARRDKYTVDAFAATVIPPAEVRDRIDQGPVWVALLEREVVGTISAVVDEDGCYVRGMGVTPAAQGSGAGSTLLAAVEDFARADGHARLWLLTTDFLHPAIRLYRRAGFDVVPTDANLHGTPLISMEKWL